MDKTTPGFTVLLQKNQLRELKLAHLIADA
jgi:hypothetical protein